MTNCYECFKEVEVTELVIFEKDGNWLLGCIHCVKPLILYDVKVKELKEEDKNVRKVS